MVKIRFFLVGLTCGVLLWGCASFAFKYYGLEGVSYSEGKLLGPKPENDLPFSACAPDSAVKHKCVVMFTTEFKAFKTDYDGCKTQLSDCQRNCQSP